MNIFINISESLTDTKTSKTVERILTANYVKYMTILNERKIGKHLNTHNCKEYEWADSRASVLLFSFVLFFFFFKKSHISIFRSWNMIDLMKSIQIFFNEKWAEYLSQVVFAEFGLMRKTHIALHAFCDQLKFQFFYRMQILFDR